AQPPLDLAALLRQVAAAVAADRLRPELLLHQILQIGEQYFDPDAAAREYDRLNALLQQQRSEPLRFEHARLADAELMIDNRWIIENEMLLPRRCPVVVNERDRFADEPLGMLLRVRDRR